jgi:hypothetical protein
VEILGREVYHGFGPTLAAEYLASNHDIHAGREKKVASKPTPEAASLRQR